MKTVQSVKRSLSLLGLAAISATFLTAGAAQAADRTILIENFTADW